MWPIYYIRLICHVVGAVATETAVHTINFIISSHIKYSFAWPQVHPREMPLVRVPRHRFK